MGILKNIFISFFVFFGVVALISDYKNSESIIAVVMAWSIVGIIYGVMRHIGKPRARRFRPVGNNNLSQKELFQMKKEGNKQVVSRHCNKCNALNHRYIPENVIMGSMASCIVCGSLMFIPSPGSPIQGGEEAKALEEVIRNHIHEK